MISEHWKNIRDFVKWLVPFLMAVFLLFGCAPAQTQENQTGIPALQEKTELSEAPSQELKTTSPAIEEDGSYTGKEEVALYIHTYGRLPDNFITKKEAEDDGWSGKEGNLWEVAPGKSIGGSHFGNYEGSLPAGDGRKWYECDINYEGGFRGSERLIYSNDGLIYYTDDHYKTFEQLY